jgi:6-phosphogluconolactonase
VGVNPIGKDGKVGEPIQVIPTARNAHAIRTDNTNRFVFVPHLGTDQMFQFVLDKKSGKLSANTPPVCSSSRAPGRATSSFRRTTSSSICSTSSPRR